MQTPQQILNKFKLKITESSDRLFGCCPLHGGDNTTAFSMFKENGAWICFTRGCHTEYGNSLFNFTKAMIAKIKNIPFLTVKNKDVMEFLDIKGNNIPEWEPPKFIIDEPEDPQPVLMSAEICRSILNEPSSYYLRRGFSKEILLKYQVCELADAHTMNGRAIVPTFNLDGTELVGYSGRSTTDTHPKWLHSYNFKRNKNLYNQWSVGPHIEKTGTIIITEGFAKVWRLEESGIHNSVAIYGTEMGNSQIGLINQLGPSRVIILMDNDEPGKKAAKTIESKLSGFYKTKIIDTTIIDVDQTPVELIKKIIIPELI